MRHGRVGGEAAEGPATGPALGAHAGDEVDEHGAVGERRTARRDEAAEAAAGDDASGAGHRGGTALRRHGQAGAGAEPGGPRHVVADAAPAGPAQRGRGRRHRRGRRRRRETGARRCDGAEQADEHVRREAPPSARR